MQSTVIDIKQSLKADFDATEDAHVSEIYDGFSKRFNRLIDISDAEVPPIDGGRVSFLAELFGASKPATSDWLSKDKPPKDGSQRDRSGEATLFRIVGFFLKHIQNGDSIVPARVVTWLRYGDSVIPCPFTSTVNDVTFRKLSPIAASVIAQESKTLYLNTADYDFAEVMKQTVKMLVNFEISQEVDISDTHRVIIQQYLLNNTK
ncbi:hypothetical protein [Aliikangiella maris]|uniref:Uncharacterized protein n=2 Tax=Aliikangiella maris TaxID=3162458 RepID=A0ABV2BYH3_9GAMM